MGQVKDLTRQRFGRLIALSYTLVMNGNSNHRRALWLCKCDCGNLKEVQSTHLLTGATVSCGCFHKEVARNCNLKHGLKDSRFYRIWQNMMTRTSNPASLNYSNYGGRGIKVCEAWHSFQSFKSDMYESYLIHAEIHGEKNTSIERQDNEKGYSADNCRWATRKEQSSNTRRNKRYLINDELLTLTEIATKYKLSKETVFYRLKMGWSSDEVVIPPGERGGKISVNH